MIQQIVTIPTYDWEILVICHQIFLGGVTWVDFCWVCAAGFSEPLPHYSLFMFYFVAKSLTFLGIMVYFWTVYFVANDRPLLSHFWVSIFLISKSPKTVTSF